MKLHIKHPVLLQNTTSILTGILLWLVLAVVTTNIPVSALTAQERQSLARQGIAFIDDEDSCGDTGGAVGEGTISLNEAETANARTIIGIAKTYNLGRQGALIGLITGLAESNLKMYASTSIPVSRENPAWLALAEPRPIGNDHDSVGMMQQRVSTGWSTYGNGTTQEIVWQLMDSAYGAQAFFGTPRGATLPAGLNQPSALRKGLQNVDNWQSLEPWVAAQRVQISAFSDGRNYRAKMNQAQSILNANWESAPAIPLPISITGGEAPPPADGNCLQPGNAQQAILQTIFKYAWPDYRSSSRSDATVGKDVYIQATRAAIQRGEYVGDHCGYDWRTSNRVGADCGGFTTRVMRDSGADPTYNEDECNTLCQRNYLRRNSTGPNARYIRITSERDLQGGDIAVVNNASKHHTFFYVGKMTGPNGEPFNGVAASASQCGRAPMAGPTDTFSDYEWYRLIR